MTETVRRLQYRHHATMPSDSLGVTEWCVETLLSLAHDYDEFALIKVLCVINPDAPTQTVIDQLLLLYTLAEQVAEADRYIVAGDDDWQAPRALTVDEYRDQLTRVARLVRGAR